MSRRSRSSRAAPGRCRCPTVTASTPRTWSNMRGSPRLRKVLRNISSAMSMQSARPETFRDEELLADVICRLIGDARHVAVGAASPIPATAALLARERANLHSSGKLFVSLLGSRAHTFFTYGASELVHWRRQGRLRL